MSTTEQHLDLQIVALKQAGCEKIYKEKKTGTHQNRPELQRMIDQLRKGDQVIIWKLDRLARYTRDMLDICERIGSAGASFRSLSETWADTTSPGGKMILTVFAGIAEFERDLIVERTASGRMAAQSRGVKFGRPSKLQPKQLVAIKSLLSQGKSVKDVADAFNINPSTVYRNVWQ